ncbi:hypothetical protein FA13DRAFT_1632146 [Coprinellus micaceus]|uniref:Uncharacterized protein n=1 Tax=Coprinellus micaceus TaxID=71717 RepID=A0A4Y7T6I4_COPMI|nr:hypothetical protein FA13DRAFT_1632146 [Coprinellus micaceus]
MSSTPLFHDDLAKQLHNERRWRSLTDTCNGAHSPATTTAFERLVIAVTAPTGHHHQHVRYPHHNTHWNETIPPGTTKLAQFQFPARLCITGTCTASSPYFDLSLDPTSFDTIDLLATRAHFEFELINLDQGSAYPDVAKAQSLDMLRLLEKVFETQEETEEGNDKTTTPFWGTHASGRRVFHLVSDPIFQPTVYAEPIHELEDEKRRMSFMHDPEDRYGPVLGRDLLLNPPKIYNRYGKLLHPNEYAITLDDKPLVYVTSYLSL